MVSLAALKPLAFLFGPMLLPKVIAYCKSVPNAPKAHGLQIRPIPLYVSRALTLLFLTAVICLFATLPPFGPENIFSLTKSRLQIPTDVLFTRLSSIRPNGLRPSDHNLRGKIASLESRLLYLQYGPDVLADCPFCNVEDRKSYLCYALPAMLAPHLANMVVLAIVTSGFFCGTEGARWRSAATIASIAMAGIDIYKVSSYETSANARTTRGEDIDGFFWKMRVYRLLGIAVIDGILGWILYLSSTNRAFVIPQSPAIRIESATRALEVIKAKINGSGIVRKAVVGDAELRGRSNAYWDHARQFEAAMMEDREVVEGVKNALENRVNIESIATEAEAYAQNVMAAEGSIDR